MLQRQERSRGAFLVDWNPSNTNGSTGNTAVPSECHVSTGSSDFGSLASHQSQHHRLRDVGPRGFSVSMPSLADAILLLRDLLCSQGQPRAAKDNQGQSRAAKGSQGQSRAVKGSQGQARAAPASHVHTDMMRNKGGEAVKTRAPCRCLQGDLRCRGVDLPMIWDTTSP
jgi:hypothetical protein